MNPAPAPVSSCRHCQHYLPQGRRGGHCQKLNVVVQSRWDACSLAMAPFKPSWEALGDIMVWQRKALLQEAAAMTNQDLEPETIETPQPVTVAVAVNVGARWV